MSKSAQRRRSRLHQNALLVEARKRNNPKKKRAYTVSTLTSVVLFSMAVALVALGVLWMGA